jgi:hypothetical protein
LEWQVYMAAHIFWAVLQSVALPEWQVSCLSGLT